MIVRLKILLILLVSFGLFGVYSQNEENGLVKWLTFKEAQDKNNSTPKPFLVDIYTDWCGWCKVMMKTTYSNPGLAAYINQNFYPVKFNAETKDTIEFNGKIYKPLSPEPRTPHELALFFLGNNLSYPSTVFMTNQFEYRLLSQGYLKENDLEPFLVFFTENAWRNVPFEEFKNYFQKTFYDSPYQLTHQSLPKNSKAYGLNRKKIIILGANFSLTGKMMDKTTFTDTTLKEILKKYSVYYFDLERNDTLIYRDTSYFKQMIHNYPLHSLAIPFSKGRFSIPGVVFLDERNQILEMLNFYYSPQQIKPVLEYFGNDVYKSKSWSEFISGYSVSLTEKNNNKKSIKKNKK
jgi:thioredoxin-related protein